MSESKVLKPEVIAALAIVIPEIEEHLIQEFAKRLETLKAAQTNQDVVTTGVWNMNPVPGTNAPPRTPPPEIVYERRKLDAFLHWLEARRDYQLTKCKTHKVDVPGKDDVKVTKVAVDTPEDGAQRKATVRVQQLNTLIEEIRKENFEPLSQFILDFRPNPLIDAIADPRFWGRGEGQKHVGMTEKVLASLKGQGLLKDGKKTSEK